MIFLLCAIYSCCSTKTEQDLKKEIIWCYSYNFYNLNCLMENINFVERRSADSNFMAYIISFSSVQPEHEVNVIVKAKWSYRDLDSVPSNTIHSNRIIEKKSISANMADCLFKPIYPIKSPIFYPIENQERLFDDTYHCSINKILSVINFCQKYSINKMSIVNDSTIYAETHSYNLICTKSEIFLDYSHLCNNWFYENKASE